jgi:hypothetical protein
VLSNLPAAQGKQVSKGNIYIHAKQQSTETTIQGPSYRKKTAIQGRKKLLKEMSAKEKQRSKGTK